MMRNVSVVSISDQMLVSTGESQTVLVLARETGETHQLPLRVEEGELSALLQFLFQQKVSSDDIPGTPVRVDTGDEPYLVPQGTSTYSPEEYSQEDYYDEDEYGDFAGGGGIDQF